MERLGALVLFCAIGQVELVDAALADARAMADPTRIRYLDKGPQAKPDDHKVLAGHLNGLSRETDLTPPVPIGQGLYRIDLADYGWPHDLWEKLADADPWYHVTVEFKFRFYDHYRFKPEVTRSVRSFKRRAIANLGPKAAELATLTTSAAPILRMDWFFNQTCAQEGRDPGYYDFLGIKNETDFQELVGFDKKRKRRKVEIREAVADSGVSLQPRGIVREGVEDGGYWVTYDFRKAVDKVNPLRVLGRDLDKQFRDAKKEDVATEQFGPLPNGIMCWYLGNNAGERQATAPDFAASDGRSFSNDKRVHANVSCVRCHSQAGIQAIDGWVRNLISPPLALQSPDYDVLRQLRQQYLRKLEPYLERDRKTHADAIFEITGWDATIYAARYAEYWERYEDARVDAAWAARDCYVDEKTLVAKLTAYVKASKEGRVGPLDTVVAAFVRGRSIRMRQWEEAHSLALQALGAGL